MNQKQEIPPNLQNALESLRTVPARDQRHVARRRQDYLDMIDQLPSRGWLHWLRSAPRLAWLAAAALLLVVLLGSTTVTALAAQSSLPGNFLYPLKAGLEDAQLAFTRDAADQFNLLQTFTARRFSEMDALLAANQALPSMLDERLEAHFQYMVLIAATMDDPTLAQSLNGLQEMLQVREQLMTANEGQPSDPIYTRIRERVQEMNQLAAAGMADPDQFRWQFENQNGTGGETPAPGTGPGPDAGPGPGEPPTQAPAPTNPPAPTQGGFGGTPTPGGGQGFGGTPTEQPAPTQGGLGGTPTDHPGGGQGSDGTPTDHSGDEKP